jgi:hypothetical protein
MSVHFRGGAGIDSHFPVEPGNSGSGSVKIVVSLCLFESNIMRNRSHFVVAAVLFLSMPVMALAAQKPRDLAMESYRFMEATQGKLTVLIKDANTADYFAQFSNPAKTIANKWPQPFQEEYYDYANCYFALDLLIKYADKAVVEKSQKDPVLVARKARFGNALRECQRDLRKMP